MRRYLPAVITALLWFAPGCEQPSFPHPLTAAQAAQARTGAALAHYLAQPDATATICSATSHGPRLGALSTSDLEDLVHGLTDGTVPAAPWKSCANALFASAPAEESARFLDAMGYAYRSLLRNGDLEKPAGASLRARLQTLHETFVLRPTGAEPHVAVLADLIADLREALTRGKLGPEATRYGEDLVVTIDLARGIWRGRPVDAAALDGLQTSKDEAMLKRFELRLPDPAQRTMARARIIRLHIAASEWPEVREHAEEVEALVLSTGQNAVNLDVHPPVRGSLNMSRSLLHAVLVRQNVPDQRATILGYGEGQPGISVVPTLDLHGVLGVELRGLSGLVSLCEPPEDLEVAPCIPPTSVGVDNPLAYLDGDGNFHFSEHVPLSTAVALVYDQPRISLPVRVAGQPLVTLELPVYFERPSDVLFEGSTGERGPNLGVRVEQRDSERLVFSVNAGRHPQLAVVELRDAGSFSIVSRGGDGADGSPGFDGAPGPDGTSGISASCPSFSGQSGGNGGLGGNGGPGGNGGDGGAGGDVSVEVACKTSSCSGLDALVRRIVRSQGGDGGAGGAGGRGGRGGRGGSGGSGTTCTDGNGNTFSLSGGSDGMSGSNGFDGSPGSPGAGGKPGRVDLVAVP
jgi:hypothetical protein